MPEEVPRHPSVSAWKRPHWALSLPLMTLLGDSWHVPPFLWFLPEVGRCRGSLHLESHLLLLVMSREVPPWTFSLVGGGGGGHCDFSITTE